MSTGCRGGTDVSLAGGLDPWPRIRSRQIRRGAPDLVGGKGGALKLGGSLEAGRAGPIHSLSVFTGRHGGAWW
ncbi:hypothetical protein E2562_038023 [Oryza meyeriana var. granulata]|uniref:Uncharacterized protein n=1 Tax=Oryza meyeriana var. granulata TaxID=110450 RepID=A0A6G1EF34_9ORYZ|nr:hypothetical protein E2562_038023 [Oryza meyeriana var. granulata]